MTCDDGTVPGYSSIHPSLLWKVLHFSFLTAGLVPPVRFRNCSLPQLGIAGWRWPGIMPAPCSDMTAATSVTGIIGLTGMGVQGYDSLAQQAWRAKLVTGLRGPVAPTPPQSSLREGRGAPGSARCRLRTGGGEGRVPGPRGKAPLGGWAAGEGRARDVPGAAAEERGGAGSPALPCPPLSGPGAGRLPAQVRPRRPEPRPPAGRGLARPGPAQPAAPRPPSPRSRPGAVRVSVRPGPAEPRRRCAVALAGPGRGRRAETMPVGRPAPPLPEPWPRPGACCR